MEGPKIQVVVRKRPMTARELRHNNQNIVQITSQDQLVIKQQKQNLLRVKVDLTKYTQGHPFTFDRVFQQTMTNQDIYLLCVKPLINAAFQGAKITCFAYGQTGSGKTYTMLGQGQVAGLYLLAANDLFQVLHSRKQPLKVYVSFYEIYCGKLHDLLNDRQQLYARQDSKQNVNIVGLQQREVRSVEEVMRVIQFGLSVRITGITAANDQSSRSHAILQIALRTGKKVHGKISFIDLAGSERGADTMQNGKQTRIDGAQINKSLLALKECIRALDQDHRHTPFRGSKLTQVLKDSFTGKCKTVMIANISPSSGNCEHTLNTLRYADRVKELKKGKTHPKSVQDNLANNLMLPRQPSATVRMNLVRPNNLNQKSRIQPKQETSPIARYLDPKWKASNQQDLQQMSEEHEKLISQILSEEEELIASHRQHIDHMVDVVKQEMNLLNDVDKPGSDVDVYVSNLNKILQHKVEVIQELQGKLNRFHTNLRMEEKLSMKFYSLQNEVLDVYDLEEQDLDNLL